MFNKIKDAYIAVKATLRAIIKDGKIIFIYRCAVIAAIIILYLKWPNNFVKNVIKYVTAIKVKTNAATATVMGEKKIEVLKMKVV